jgi:two-component system, OmpR family, sensor kinase
MSLPIRARLTLWYLALLAVVLLVLGGFLTLRLRTGLVRGLDASLATRAAQISLGLKNGCEGEFQDVSNASLVGLPQGESGAQLLGPAGDLLETTGDQAVAQPLLSAEQVRAVLGGATVSKTVRTPPDGESFRALASSTPAGACKGVIVVATSTEEVVRSVRELLLQLSIGGPIALLIAGLGGWWLAGRALAPVARMTREADTIGIEHLDERIVVPSATDEIRRLALTLNAMLDRIERGVEDKRRFAADASHELRTPLAVMGAELDVSLREADLTQDARSVLESAREEVERMRTIVENLLTLARADDGSLDMLPGTVDLHDIAAQVSQNAAVLAQPKRVVLNVDGASATVRGDPARIEQVVTNLVDNAIRFSPGGGSVRIHTWTDDEGAGCTVEDEGPGVSPELAGSIFDRFVRGESARSSGGGTGLGLAICREIVTAHGGRIWVDAKPGAGGSFSFWLPAWSNGRLAS